ncbi:Dam family site-specific DNA-(adenine-N6)-methyltransferase [Lactobacillus sp.]|uniref:Dam family site-specific DNA-(adenine-N6)-methyltransferase n=1 Tax=Lactobacillus sp. TaxID=1591 RepID=UPI0025C53C06|nr:Dam family site-specific DNA-(adenine-N6)-methyltransferase [Lactobacillus sp.]
MNHFWGGGATYFALQPKKARLGDINNRLIKFYLNLVNNYPTVKDEISHLSKEYEENRQIEGGDSRRNSDMYYRVRDMFNGKAEPTLDFATIYYVINHLAYSGIIRYNKKGEYNIAYGWYAHLNSSLLTDEHYELLKTAEINKESYEKSFEQASSKDFIFLDPPYDCTYSSYGNLQFIGDFKEDEHRKLAQDFKNLSAKALMIIAATDLTKELYAPYVQDEYRKNYSLNIKNRFQLGAEHLVVANYDIREIERS